MILGSRVHKLPWRDPAARPDTAPQGAHLKYYGGRLNASAQVVVVLWGTGSYEPHVASTGTPSMFSFYNQLLGNGAMTGWLDGEYNSVEHTFNGAGSNQHIGTGAAAGVVSIAPSTDSVVIEDSDIQLELANQIAAGQLPAPQHDAQGNNTTYYAVFFPSGKTIVLDDSNSCEPGGFCAYHGTIAQAGRFGEIYYGVHPDMQEGSGCDDGCGPGTVFDNTSSVASHELVEMITDPEVGLVNDFAPPLAWYDGNYGEIGDICNAQQTTYTACDGQTYTSQLEFSNAQQDCIGFPAPSCGAQTPDFTLAAAAVTIPAGSNGTSTLVTTAVSGAGTVGLALSRVPAGVTADISPPSVAAGSNATVSISVGSTVAAGSYTLTVAGTEGTRAHSTSIALTVTSPGGGGGGGVPLGGIVNGGFEAGWLGGWIAGGPAASIVTGGRGSTYAAQLGASDTTGATSGDSTLAQTFLAPDGAAALSFFYLMTCSDSVDYDWATAWLRDDTAGTGVMLLGKVCETDSDWVKVTGTLIPGHTYTLTFTSHADEASADANYIVLDDVAISAAAGGGGAGSSLTNGDFEAGTLAGWTSSGAAASVVPGGHGGAYAARVGSTGPTDGDSSISQTFTAAAGTRTVSFWYMMSCPDTVQYDWATATLRDDSAGTTSTVLARTCTSNGWTQEAASVIAGHSYTLTLASHDDNYSADPTYTLFDDVSVQ
ncbi:MAG TPA: hypothetical protein VLW85_00325 [Myxococcales bacterium]|nr:hypothetical protein [Myxococcales bacterium]